MPHKDREVRNAYNRALHAKRKAEDPEWIAKRSAQQKVALDKRLKEEGGYAERRKADYRRWYAEHGKEEQRNRKGCIPWEQWKAECDEKRRKSAEYMKAWGQTEVGKRNRVAHSIKRRCGLTIEEYDETYDAQQGRCKICQTEKPRYEKDRLVVDHCHLSGGFRALLCSNCNSAIGLLGEDPAVLQSAIEYLKSVKKE